MKKAQAVKLWKDLNESTEMEDVLRKYERRGYGGRRTLQRYAQADRGFRQGARVEDLSKQTGWSVNYLKKIQPWWEDIRPVEAYKQEIGNEFNENIRQRAVELANQNQATDVYREELPKGMLGEVQRIRQTVAQDHLQPLRPSGGLESMLHEALRKRCPNEQLPDLLDGHEAARQSVLGLQDHSRRKLLEHLKALLEKSEIDLDPNIWADQLLETLKQRVRHGGPAPAEHRVYTAPPNPEDQNLVRPDWGGYSLAANSVTAARFVTRDEERVIRDLHRKARSFAEDRILPVLGNSYDALNMAVAKLIDVLNVYMLPNAIGGL